MSTFDENQHPRGESGKWAPKQLANGSLEIPLLVENGQYLCSMCGTADNAGFTDGEPRCHQHLVTIGTDDDSDEFCIDGQGVGDFFQLAEALHERREAVHTPQCFACSHRHDPNSAGQCWEAACAPDCDEGSRCPMPYTPDDGA